MKRTLALLMAVLMLAAVLPAAPAQAATACNHKWINGQGTPATCTMDGSMLRYCEYCRTQQMVTQPKLGHDWGPWEGTAPACKTGGDQWRYCRRCRMRDERVTNALGHDYGPWVMTIDPSCTEPGRYETFCQRCKLPWVEYPEALGHDWGEWYVSKQPTVDECGEERRDCARCGIFELRELDRLSQNEPGPKPAPDPAPAPEQGDEALTVHKTVFSQPANGMYYIEGEQVSYGVEVTNRGSSARLFVYIHDDLDPEHEAIGAFDELAPGEKAAAFAVYTVTAADVLLGEVVNVARCSSQDRRGNTYHDVSNMVVIPTGGEQPAGLTVEKQLMTLPANGTYYTQNENLLYRITVTNATGYDIADVTVTDWMAGGAPAILGTVAAMAKDEARSFIYSYKVTEADVQKGFVLNYANADYTVPGWGMRCASSGPVTALTAPEGGTSVPIIPPVCFTEEDGYTPCVRTLTGLSEQASCYDLQMCALHRQAALDAAAAMANGDSAGMQAAWSKAICEMYAAAYHAAVGTEASQAVMLAQIMFFAEVQQHQRALIACGAEEDEAANAINSLMMNHCADLCNELQTAPAQRADSYAGHFGTLEAIDSPASCTAIMTMNGMTDMETILALCPRHTEEERMIQHTMQTVGMAEGAEAAKDLHRMALENAYRTVCANQPAQLQQAMAADLSAYITWLSARESMLTLMYPDSTPAEIVAQAIAVRAAEMCR